MFHQKQSTMETLKTNLKRLITGTLSFSFIMMLGSINLAMGQTEEEDSEPEIIAPEIMTEQEMRDFKWRLNSMPPSTAADSLDQFINRYRLDSINPDTDPAEDVYEIDYGDIQGVPRPGITNELQSQVDAADPSDQILAIMQFEHKPTFRDYEQVADFNVRGLFRQDWIGQTAHIVSFRAGNFGSIADIGMIRHLGHIPPENKLMNEYNGIAIAHISPLDHDRSVYRRDLQENQVTNITWNETLKKYRVELDREKARQVKDLWWIRAISFKQPNQEHQLEDEELLEKFNAQDSRIMSGIELTRKLQTKRSGEGVSIGILEGGLPYDDHETFPQGTFADGSEFGNRRHMTHVAGIIASRNVDDADFKGEFGASGMATEASLFTPVDGFQNVTFFDELADHNVNLSNHSWGHTTNHPSTFNYSQTSREFDEATLDDQLFVNAAGNEGDGNETVTGPATAKNVISVGAISYMTEDGNTGIGEVTNYSSRGPTLDAGRLKPEIVAPGGHRGINAGFCESIYGVVASEADHTEDGYNIGNCDQFMDTGEYSEMNDWVKGEEEYVRLHGTSMAAPHVTGTLGLLKEKWSAAPSHKLKARLIGTTIPIEANSENPLAGYGSVDAGYGLLNAYNASDISFVSNDEMESETLLWKSNTFGPMSSEVVFALNTYDFTVPESTEKLVGVINYNDEPGSSGGLIDQLSMTMEAPDGETFQHELPPSVDGESPLQKIVIEDPQEGEWDLRSLWDNPGIGPKDYTVFVYAINREPDIEIVETDMPNLVWSDRSFSGEVRVENPQGWIAAGVTSWIESGDSGLEGQVDFAKNLNNLKYQGHSDKAEFQLETPDEPQSSMEVRVCADAVNKGIEEACETVSISSLFLRIDPVVINPDLNSSQLKARIEGLPDLEEMASANFRWGRDSAQAGELPNTTEIREMRRDGSFTGEISELETNTTYFFRPKLVAGEDTLYGDLQQFSTSPRLSAEGGITEGPLYDLEQNKPNPFSDQTEIAFTLPYETDVTLEVYNAMDRRVATVAEGPHEAGEHTQTFKAQNLAPGVYFYRLKSEYGTLSERMILR